MGAFNPNLLSQLPTSDYDQTSGPNDESNKTEPGSFAEGSLVLLQTCGESFQVSPANPVGYIKSPGYPFGSAALDCSWAIAGPPG